MLVEVEQALLAEEIRATLDVATGGGKLDEAAAARFVELMKDGSIMRSEPRVVPLKR